MIACIAGNNADGAFCLLPIGIDGEVARSQEDVAVFDTANTFVTWKIDGQHTKRIWLVSATPRKTVERCCNIIYDTIVHLLMKKLHAVDPTISVTDIAISSVSDSVLSVSHKDGRKFNAVLVNSVEVQISEL